MNLFEAFDKLKNIDEDIFGTDKKDLRELDEFIHSDDTDSFVDIYDSEYEEDKKHADDCVLECSVCHSKMYKNKEDITLDEDVELANVDEECPYCHSKDGYTIVGEIDEREVIDEDVANSYNYKDNVIVHDTKEDVFFVKGQKEKFPTSAEAEEFVDEIINAKPELFESLDTIEEQNKELTNKKGFNNYKERLRKAKSYAQIDKIIRDIENDSTLYTNDIYQLRQLAGDRFSELTESLNESKEERISNFIYNNFTGELKQLDDCISYLIRTSGVRDDVLSQPSNIDMANVAIWKFNLTPKDKEKINIYSRNRYGRDYNFDYNPYGESLTESVSDLDSIIQSTKPKNNETYYFDYDIIDDEISLSCYAYSSNPKTTYETSAINKIETWAKKIATKAPELEASIYTNIESDWFSGMSFKRDGFHFKINVEEEEEEESDKPIKGAKIRTKEPKTWEPLTLILNDVIKPLVDQYNPRKKGAIWSAYEENNPSNIYYLALDTKGFWYSHLEHDYNEVLDDIYPFILDESCNKKSKRRNGKSLTESPVALADKKGTVASVLNDHMNELSMISDAREMARKAVELIDNSDIADKANAEKFRQHIESAARKGKYTLLSTLAAYISGINSLERRRNKAVGESLKEDIDDYAEFGSYITAYFGENIPHKILSILDNIIDNAYEMYNNFGNLDSAITQSIDDIIGSSYNEYTNDRVELAAFYKIPADRADKVDDFIFNDVKDIMSGMDEYLTEDIGNELDKYQRWVDYDMKRYKKISDQTNREIKEAGLKVVKDKYGDYEVIAGDDDLNELLDVSVPVNLDLKNNTVAVGAAGGMASANEACGKKSKTQLRKDKKSMKESFDNDTVYEVRDRDTGDVTEFWDENEAIEFAQELNDAVIEEVVYENGTFNSEDYRTEIWNSSEGRLRESKSTKNKQRIKESKIKKRKLMRAISEALEDVEVNTDNQRIVVSSDENGKVTVITEPREAELEVSEETEEVIEPVSPETEAELTGDDSEPTSDEEEIEFDEESFDEVAESYLRKLDENVASYKTKKISRIRNTNKFIIEGIIRYANRSRKLNKFVFESKKQLQSKNILLGENLTKNGKSSNCKLFTTIKNNKLITEGMWVK